MTAPHIVDPAGVLAEALALTHGKCPRNIFVAS